MKVVHAPKQKASKSSYKAASALKRDKDGWRSNIFILALILMLICSIVAGALALINANTKDLIQKYEEETRVAALQALFPTADDFEDVTEMVAGQADTENILAIYKAYAGDQLLGYCVDLETNGFSSSTPIELMVGSSPMNKVTAISVVNHGETPGIGAGGSGKEPGIYGPVCGRRTSNLLYAADHCGQRRNDHVQRCCNRIERRAESRGFGTGCGSGRAERRWNQWMRKRINRWRKSVGSFETV